MRITVIRKNKFWSCMVIVPVPRDGGATAAVPVAFSCDVVLLRCPFFAYLDPKLAQALRPIQDKKDVMLNSL